MSGHTPDPWFWTRDEGTSSADMNALFGADGREVLKPVEGWGRGDLGIRTGKLEPSGPVDTAEALANRSLIAAAPDLLAACKLAERHHQGMHSEPGIALRAAIAKAEGR